MIEHFGHRFPLPNEAQFCWELQASLNRDLPEYVTYKLPSNRRMQAEIDGILLTKEVQIRKSGCRSYMLFSQSLTAEEASTIRKQLKLGGHLDVRYKQW